VGETSRSFELTAWREGRAGPGARRLAEETAIAISYNGSSHAVLMATPADLEDLAVGFSFTEGLVDDVRAIEEISVVAYDCGLDIQIHVRSDIANRLARRRRSMAGPVGCGLCGLESLEVAARVIPPVTSRATCAAASIAAAI
jgi:FdhD protein